jgi:hypothetical protein
LGDKEGKLGKRRGFSVSLNYLPTMNLFVVFQELPAEEARVDRDTTP